MGRKWRLYFIWWYDGYQFRLAFYLYRFNCIDYTCYVLIKHTPETKAEPIGNQPSKSKFDVIGLVILVVCMLSINVIITQTSNYGLFSPIILGLIAVFIISLIAFVIYENRVKHPLVDFEIFKIKAIPARRFLTLC